MTKMAPFRMIGNLYFVGTKEASCHVLDTGDGLIMIDVGYIETVEAIKEAFVALGFNFKDVKYILLSHGHYDHTDGVTEILKLSPNAKTYMSFHDIKYIKGFTPDFDITDGIIISLGNTEVKCLFTPGHTEGSVSFFFDVVEDGKTYRAAMFGGSGTNQLKMDFMKQYHVPLCCRDLFFESIDRLLKENVDVMVGNHSWQNNTKGKFEMMKTAEVNPFIDPTEWAKYLLKLKGQLEEIIASEL